MFDTGRNPLPYPIPAGVTKPGKGSDTMRVLHRLFYGVVHLRRQGWTDITAHLTAADYDAATLYPNGVDYIGIALKRMRADSRQGSHFRMKGAGGNAAFLPVITDADFIAALRLRPGMTAVTEASPARQIIGTDPNRSGFLMIAGYAYTADGEPFDRGAPRLRWVWDHAAMTAAMARGELNDDERALFARVLEQSQA